MAKILAYDPGAERMGFAVLEGDGVTAPKYIDSGIVRVPMKDMDYQPYKLHLIEQWTWLAPAHLVKYEPDLIVCETMPAVGYNNSTQAELAKAAIITVMAMAFEREIPVHQIAATTVKKHIAGNHRATKVKVRDGMIGFLPELAPRRMQWQDSKKTLDESDALGIGLAKLGYSVHKLGLYGR
jgi:Holliday junction resolvasome RuvABC endonuclease subunit